MTAMGTKEISREQWPEFFERFTSRHAGWLVTVEVDDPDLGAQELARDVPLLEMSAETHGGSPPVISITAGRSREGHVTHRIDAPTRVRLLQTPEGADEALETESAGGAKTLVRFRAAALPETVDGLIPEP